MFLGEFRKLWKKQFACVSSTATTTSTSSELTDQDDHNPVHHSNDDTVVVCEDNSERLLPIQSLVGTKAKKLRKCRKQSLFLTH